MQALLLDIAQQKLKPLPDSNLETCYKYIKTYFVEYAYSNIGGRTYVIIFDGTDQAKIATAFDLQNKPVFFGNLVICKHNKKGEDIALTENDIQHICKHTRNIVGRSGQHPVLTGVDCPISSDELPDAADI